MQQRYGIFWCICLLIKGLRFNMGKFLKYTKLSFSLASAACTYFFFPSGSYGSYANREFRWKEIHFCMCRWFSRFTWTYFLREKSETFDKFKMLCTKLQNEMNSNIKSIKWIQSDHGREFENAMFEPVAIVLASPMSFRLLGHLNKMELLRGNIGSFKRWPEWCCLATMCLGIYGPKPSTRLAI